MEVESNIEVLHKDRKYEFSYKLLRPGYTILLNNINVRIYSMHSDNKKFNLYTDILDKKLISFLIDNDFKWEKNNDNMIIIYDVDYLNINLEWDITNVIENLNYGKEEAKNVIISFINDILFVEFNNTNNKYKAVILYKIIEHIYYALFYNNDKINMNDINDVFKAININNIIRLVYNISLKLGEDAAIVIYNDILNLKSLNECEKNKEKILFRLDSIICGLLSYFYNILFIDKQEEGNN